MKKSDYHISKEIKSSYSDILSGKKIILGICGSTSSYKSIDLSRLLIRHGADVIPVMTPESMKYITPQLLHWATGNMPLTETSGKTEHIMLAGKHEKAADCLVIYPATATTINKISCGIADNPLTLLTLTAIGSGIPVAIFPAMHTSLFNNPIIQDNISRLREYSVNIFAEKEKEGKIKIIPPKKALLHIMGTILSKEKFIGKKILITAGATREFFDSIRFISNPSTGLMGINIANIAAIYGAIVTLLLSEYALEHTILPDIKLIRFKSHADLMKKIIRLISSEKYDIYISTAAISDFIPEKLSSDKIDSGTEINLILKPSKKIIDKVRELSTNIVICGFKAETDIQKLYKESEEMLFRDIDMVVANLVGDTGFGTGETEIHIFKKNKEVKTYSGNKFKVSAEILESLQEFI